LQRAGELAERRRGIVRDAEPVDLAGLPRLLEQRQLLLPRDEIVDLLELDAAEPAELRVELLLPLGGRTSPDLLGDDRSFAALAQRVRERLLCGAVHRRGVEHARAGL